MKTLRLILGDQLTRGIAALSDVVAGDVVLMVEVWYPTLMVRDGRSRGGLLTMKPPFFN